MCKYEGRPPFYLVAASKIRMAGLTTALKPL